MINNTLVSVVIPTFNSEQTILRTLESVLTQKYKNIEIIMIDDGSIDNTKNLINDFFKDKTIEYKYIYQKNSGPSGARNNGVKNSNGEYIAFLDSDDEWNKDKLQIQMNIIKEKKLNFLGSTYTYNQFDSINKELVLKKFSFNQLLLKTQFSTPGVIIKKDLFISLGGFDENMKYAEDNDLWLRVAIKNDLYLIKEPKLVRLYKSAYGESGLSGNMWAMYFGELFLLKKLLQSKNLNILKYVFLFFFITVKFFRRLIKRYLIK
ncbi:MAG: glycosyl transferase [Arcobacter sp.]|nr:glycosyl transferase [Arcobacter sp.]